KRIRHRSLVVNIGLHGLKLRIFRTKLSVSPIRMPWRNPNRKSATAQTPNDAAAEKASSAEHGDGATAPGRHGSNSPVHVEIPRTAGGRDTDSGDGANGSILLGMMTSSFSSRAAGRQQPARITSCAAPGVT